MEENQPLNVRVNLEWTGSLKEIFTRLYSKLKIFVP
jgi:hypothetical protein